MSCEWVFDKMDHELLCPKCGFESYSAYYVFGKKAYQYKLTQEQWIKRKMYQYEVQLRLEVQNLRIKEGF
jgi:hypothetical protein